MKQNLLSQFDIWAQHEQTKIEKAFQEVVSEKIKPDIDSYTRYDTGATMKTNQLKEVSNTEYVIDYKTPYSSTTYTDITSNVTRTHNSKATPFWGDEALRNEGDNWKELLKRKILEK